MLSGRGGDPGHPRRWCRVRGSGRLRARPPSRRSRPSVPVRDRRQWDFLGGGAGGEAPVGLSSRAPRPSASDCSPAHLPCGEPPTRSPPSAPLPARGTADQQRCPAMRRTARASHGSQRQRPGRHAASRSCHDGAMPSLQGCATGPTGSARGVGSRICAPHEWCRVRMRVEACASR